MNGEDFLNDLLLKGLLVKREDCEVTDVSPCIADSTRIKFIGRINKSLGCPAGALPGHTKLQAHE